MLWRVRDNPCVAPQTVSVRPVEDSDRDWLRETLTQLGQLRIVSRGHLTEDAARLPGLLAERGGSTVGYALVRVDRGELEVVALQALRRREGIGTALLAAAADEARRAGCARAWLITTNDNLDALRFYQRRGWDLVALHHDCVTAGRKLKPELPEVGDYGLPIRHELEFELLLST
jgi:ribosomal protein S18 acetylase RimI-like enzyme